jgi:hypothetical protein
MGRIGRSTIRRFLAIGARMLERRASASAAADSAICRDIVPETQVRLWDQAEEPASAGYTFYPDTERRV